MLIYKIISYNTKQPHMKYNLTLYMDNSFKSSLTVFKKISCKIKFWPLGGSKRPDR